MKPIYYKKNNQNQKLFTVDKTHSQIMKNKNYKILKKICDDLGLLPENDNMLIKNEFGLLEQDMIWKKICDELEWDFFPEKLT